MGNKYKHVGTTQVHHFEKKKKTFSDQCSEVIGVIFLCFIVGVILVQCAG